MARRRPAVRRALDERARTLRGRGTRFPRRRPRGRMRRQDRPSQVRGDVPGRDRHGPRRLRVQGRLRRIFVPATFPRRRRPDDRRREARGPPRPRQKAARTRDARVGSDRGQLLRLHRALPVDGTRLPTLPEARSLRDLGRERSADHRRAGSRGRHFQGRPRLASGNLARWRQSRHDVRHHRSDRRCRGARASRDPREEDEAIC
mmetsp:Transcript_24497/g.79137  ORF Transcript_24497/g.79137 Transcript_24497/m.79137 type:complete len:204 (+) Transcript_24497:3738-4349(+)